MYQCSKKAGHLNNTVILIFQQIQCLNLMYSGVAWVLLSSRKQVQPQIILDTDYLPDYLFFSYDFATMLHSRIFSFSYSVLQITAPKICFLTSWPFVKKSTCKFLQHVDGKTIHRKLGQR